MDCDIYQGNRSRNRTRQLQKAKRDRQEARCDSYAKQQKYLEETIQNRNKDKKGIKITDKIICIKRGEKLKQLYNSFVQLRNKQDSSTLSFIDVLDKVAFWAANLILMTILFANTSTFIIIVTLIFYEHSLNY
eukprot:7025642-Ditylum_brightwellii.AAC.1